MTKWRDPDSLLTKFPTVTVGNISKPFDRDQTASHRDFDESKTRNLELDNFEQLLKSPTIVNADCRETVS